MPVPTTAQALPVLVGGTTFVQTLITLASLCVATLAPAIARTLDVSPAVVGHQMSLVYAAAAISAVGAGSLVTRLGACRTSQVSLVLGAAGCLTVASGSVALLAIGSLLIGLGYGMTNPASSHLLNRFAPDARRNLIFSIKQTGVPLGGVAAGLTLPPLSLVLGWSGALIAAAVAIALTAGVLQPLRHGWDNDRQPEARLNGRFLVGLYVVVRNPPIRRLAVTAFCYAAVQLCLTTFVVTLLVEDLSRALVTAGGIASIVQVTGAFGRIAWGWVADRLGDGLLTLIGIGLITAICSIAVSGITPAWPVVAIAALLAVFGFAAIGWNGVFLAEVARLAPADAVGQATGGALFFTFAGVVFGPSLFAVTVAWMDGYAATFPLLALFSIGGILPLIRTAACRRTPGSDT